MDLGGFWRSSRRGSISGRRFVWEANGRWRRWAKLWVGPWGGGERDFSGVVTDIREESRVAGKQRWQMAL